ncbi:MAG: hypothetical protein H7831_04735 [Magnetococcus sp. WYHC-3]
MYNALYGPAWDFDSFNSALSFNLVLHPDYQWDVPLGALPKLGAMALYWAAWHLGDGFHLLTGLTLLLVAAVGALMVVWCRQLGGAWPVLLTGLAMNTHGWTLAIMADNPAWGLPLLLLGLYAHFALGWWRRAALLVLLSCLFRPGGEVVLLVLGLLVARRQGLRAVWWHGLLLVLALLHATQTWRLIYPDAAAYWVDVGFYFDRSYEKYQAYLANHRVTVSLVLAALVEYTQSAVKEMGSKYSLLFVPGALMGGWWLWRRGPGAAAAPLWIVTSTYPLLVSAGWYGDFSVMRIGLAYKQFPWAWAVVWLAAFAPWGYVWGWLSRKGAGRRTALALGLGVLLGVTGLVALAGWHNRAHSYWELDEAGAGAAQTLRLGEAETILAREWPAPGRFSAQLDYRVGSFFLQTFGPRVHRAWMNSPTGPPLGVPAFGDYDVILAALPSAPLWEAPGYDRWILDHPRGRFGLWMRQGRGRKLPVDSPQVLNGNRSATGAVAGIESVMN